MIPTDPRILPDVAEARKGRHRSWPRRRTIVVGPAQGRRDRQRPAGDRPHRGDPDHVHQRPPVSMPGSDRTAAASSWSRRGRRGRCGAAGSSVAVRAGPGRRGRDRDQFEPHDQLPVHRAARTLASAIRRGHQRGSGPLHGLGTASGNLQRPRSLMKTRAVRPLRRRWAGTSPALA